MPTTTTEPQAPVSAERQPALRAGAAPPLVSVLTIPGHARHARTAREFIALMLGAHSWPDEGIADLLVSEIVANSVRHSQSGQPGGTITVTVTAAPGQFLIEVMDHGGPGHPVVRPAGDSDDRENGRGLRLVADLAADWGYYRLRERLVTWFECALEAPDCIPGSAGRNLEDIPGSMAYPELKGNGDSSMVRREALYRIPCSAGRNLVECSWV